MDISVPTILAALLPVLATTTLCALMLSAAVLLRAHKHAKGVAPRR